MVSPGGPFQQVRPLMLARSLLLEMVPGKTVLAGQATWNGPTRDHSLPPSIYWKSGRRFPTIHQHDDSHRI